MEIETAFGGCVVIGVASVVTGCLSSAGASANAAGAAGAAGGAGAAGADGADGAVDGGRATGAGGPFCIGEINLGGAEAGVTSFEAGWVGLGGWLR